MLQRQIERVSRSGAIDRLVIATSTDSADDPIEALCRDLGISCSRGSLIDVLNRFVTSLDSLAIDWNTDSVVRLTADCPLFDSKILDDLLDFFLTGSFDYASNTLKPTFPDGLDCEVFKASALLAAHVETTSNFDREHVTPFIYGRAERFKLGSFECAIDRSRLRWTVDEPEDLVFVSNVYEQLFANNPNFGMTDVLELLDRKPELKLINSGFVRNEGSIVSKK